MDKNIELTLNDFVREETIRNLENSAIDLQVSSVDYVNQFFYSINPKDIKNKLAECFTQQQIDEVVATVDGWAEDIEMRIQKKLLDNNNKYSEDELEELYPTWMASYACTAFDSDRERENKIQKAIKREARTSAKSVEQLKQINKIVLKSATAKLPSYS